MTAPGRVAGLPEHLQRYFRLRLRRCGSRSVQLAITLNPASTDNVWLNFRMGLEMVAGYSEKSFILGLAGIGGHLCVVNSAG